MPNPIKILDQDYTKWIAELSSRYRRSQIKAAVKVNSEMLQYYWELGRDIVVRDAENKYGAKFYATLCRDLQNELVLKNGFSERNIRYTKRFYLLYSSQLKNLQQLAANSQQSESSDVDSPNNNFLQQLAAKFTSELFSVPWGHHLLIIDKCGSNLDKALFFVHQTVQNGWSRNVLLNFIDTDLYERQGKALTNFKNTLPDETSDLAQELTKDPYNFAFTGITGKYNERLLKDALLNNITNFLIELGTGFAYVGKEYRIVSGEREGRDNPTIGLLICKEKDRIQAQYALESSSQPIGISEFELEKFYPEKIDGTIPTIEEIERGLESLSQSNAAEK